MALNRSFWVGLSCLACGGQPAAPSGVAASGPSAPPGDVASAPEPVAAPARSAGATEAPDGVGAAATELPSDAPTLVVSVTFDDSYASQLEAAALLEAHGLRGTFYVNSPRLHDGNASGGSGEFMSVADALGLQARGHEIGGHTLSHPSLTALPEAERQLEIMADRAQLLALGFSARSFAYPRGDVEVDDPSLGRPVLEIARASGYGNARDTNGFPLAGCTPGPERVPPGDAFLLRSIRSVNDAPPATPDDPAPPADTAQTLLGWMDHAAACGGGWLPLIFHHLRADCSLPDAPGSYCFDFPELERLALALAAGARCPQGAPCYRIEVAPVSDVLERGAVGGGEVAPALEVLALRNASLERTLASGVTECFQATQGDGGTAVLGRAELARTGLASLGMSIAEPFVAPAEIRVARDLGACAPYTAPGRAYALSLFYRAEPEGPVPELRVVTYRLTTDYTWELWESGEPFLAQSPGEWVEQSFRTAPVPEGTLAFSFGLRQLSVGAVAVDDFAAAPSDPSR